MVHSCYKQKTDAPLTAFSFFRTSTLFAPRKESGLTLPVSLDLAVLDQLLQRILNGCLTDGRYQLHDLALGELAELLADRSADQLDGR